MPESASTSSAAIDRDNPWPGLATFTEDQRAYFHGRDEEILDLTQLAERRPLVVLFGQSGLGKSSILQAGVFPRLRTDGFCPIYIRLDHAEAAPTPSEQVKALVKIETTRVGTWTRPGAAKPGETLWEFFHHRDDRLLDRDGLGVVPVLVFDQFEELFTLGAARGERRERAVAFIRELAELVENRPSAQLVARLDQSSDEMEAFDFGRTDYRVIISLREDFLPDLESLKTIMPALMQRRMRLARMTGKQALEAVLKPGAGLVTEDVARAIVEFVAGARGGSAERLAELDVEPALLSVICRELNERRRTLGQAQITADLVSGNRREILTDFYERSVADLPAPMRSFVEDRLLTKSGFRDNLALETALEFPGVTQPLIDTLVARRLLRLEDRLGVQRVELTHDVLAEVIRGSRDTRHQRRALEETKQRERIIRRRMWLARTIAAVLLVGLTGVSWIAWRAIRAEGEQTRLRADADTARKHADALRVKAEADELAALRKAYASDMNGVQRALATDNLGRARELLYRHRPEPGEVDLRGWEWRYLWQFCQSDAQSVLKEADDQSIVSLATSADGKWVAVGGQYGGNLALLNLDTREKFVVPAGAGKVHVAFSPRDPLLAIAIEVAATRGGVSGANASATLPSANRALLWNVNTRQVVREVPVDGSCFGLSFSGDGQTLAIADFGQENKITLWRVADGAKVAGWPAGTATSEIFSVLATTLDMTLAAARDSSGSVCVVDLKTGQQRWSAPAFVAATAFSPDGTILAVQAPGASAEILLLDVASGRELGRLAGHRGRVGQVLFLPDGKHLVSASADQTLRLWEIETRTSVRTLRGHKTEVWRVALLPDRRTIVSGSKDGSVFLWDLNAGRETAAAGLVEAPFGSWAFAGGGDSLVTVDFEGRVVQRQGRTYQEEKPLVSLGPIVSAILDPKRPLLAALTRDEKLQVWDWDRRVLVREFAGLIGSQQAIPQQFSADGSKLAVRLASAPGVFSYREWEIATGRETHALDVPLDSGSQASEAYSSDGKKFAVFRFPTGEGQLLDLEAGLVTRLKLELFEPGSRPDFSPDGRFLAVPSLRSNVRIFDVAANRELATLRGYMFGVHSAAYSPDGQRLASGGTEIEAINLWDTQSHERLLTLAARAGSLWPTKFSPDGSVLAAQTGYITRRLYWYFWRAPSWAEIEKAEAGR